MWKHKIEPLAVRVHENDIIRKLKLSHTYMTGFMDVYKQSLYIIPVPGRNFTFARKDLHTK